jgi:predicted nucleic acid-binding protein
MAQGRIVAVKGLGGFLLMADARNAATLARLRERKPRRDKPFALMVRDLTQARALVELDASISERAAGLEPLALRSLDAIHLATGLELEPDLALASLPKRLLAQPYPAAGPVINSLISRLYGI